MDEQVVRANTDVAVAAGLILGQQVQGRTDSKRRQDVRGNLQAEPAPDRPGLFQADGTEIDLAAHDHVDELVARREVLIVDADGVLRIGISGRVDDDALAGALEVAERGAASGVEQRLDRCVRVLRRVMDLRHVVNRGDPVVELGEAAEQLADVDVLRPIDRREAEQDRGVVGVRAFRRRIVVEDQHAVGEVAAQRRLELVMVGVDEPGHDDAAAGVDHTGITCAQVRADGEDLLALDQHVRRDEVADRRVHRHHGAAFDDVAGACRRNADLGRRRTRREQTEARCRGARRCRNCEKAAACDLPRAKAGPLAEMPLRHSGTAQYTHVCISPIVSHSER